jgi:hypothetical protein
MQRYTSLADRQAKRGKNQAADELWERADEIKKFLARPEKKHAHVGVVTIDRGETCQVCGKDMHDPIHSQSDASEKP